MAQLCNGMQHRYICQKVSEGRGVGGKPSKCEKKGMGVWSFFHVPKHTISRGSGAMLMYIIALLSRYLEMTLVSISLSLLLSTMTFYDDFLAFYVSDNSERMRTLFMHNVIVFPGADLGFLVWWGCRYNCAQSARKILRPRPLLMSHAHFSSSSRAPESDCMDCDLLVSTVNIELYHA